MTKVAYSVTKYDSRQGYRMTGIGKIEENDLILKNGKRLEDVISKCKPIPYKQNEFKGNYDEFQEIEVETKFGNYDTIEVWAEYKVWYKLI